MEIIRPGTDFDFLGKRTMFFGISAAVILLGLVSLVIMYWTEARLAPES